MNKKLFFKGEGGREITYLKSEKYTNVDSKEIAVMQVGGRGVEGVENNTHKPHQKSKPTRFDAYICLPLQIISY